MTPLTLSSIRNAPDADEESAVKGFRRPALGVQFELLLIGLRGRGVEPPAALIVQKCDVA
jgi:hypothetical protein